VRTIVFAVTSTTSPDIVTVLPPQRYLIGDVGWRMLEEGSAMGGT
jgi:hypothetical protein